MVFQENAHQHEAYRITVWCARDSGTNLNNRKLHAEYYFTTSLFNRINDSNNQIVFVITESTLLRIESLE